MKYTLINCYSDNNRGDLAIILATLKLIREHDPDASITGISTYNATDPCYASEHHLLSQQMPVFPALFGVVNVGSSRSLPLKLLRFALDTLRLVLTLAAPRGLQKLVHKLFYSKREQESIRQIEQADYIVSKGGSFICSDPDLRSRIALVRLLYIFLLCIKLGKPPVILCQSIGPYYGPFTRRLTNYVLRHSASVVLREDICTERYPYIELPKVNSVATDIAFFADALPAPGDVPFVTDRLRVGMTIKHVAPAQAAQYRTMFIDAIEHCVNVHGAHVYIFPHVTIEDDIGNAFDIYKGLSDKTKLSVTIFSREYHALQLKAIYREMDVFVGTRLHSTIFALSENVPAVCVTYHGTKALGVFNTLGLRDFVVTDYDSRAICDKIDRLVANRRAIKDELTSTLARKKREVMATLALTMPVAA